LAGKVDRPIVLPLSNPTDKAEAQAEDLIRWTAGRALVATGSPSPPVSYEGRKMAIAQCNNVYIFPAVGLGLVASRARRVTDGMMRAAARALAENSPARCDPASPLLPPLTDIRRVAVQIAVAVGLEAQRAGVAPETSEQDLLRQVLKTQWTPAYAGAT
jgi:malate dehydrogenase (oxaloacetate-decarboxylating)